MNLSRCLSKWSPTHRVDVAGLSQAQHGEDGTSMSTQNISEVLFEKYLISQSLSFEFEKPYSGKSKLVDYTVPIDGRDFLFEVKQFEQKNYPLPQGGPTFIDPCRAIRSKIDQAKDKFKEYEEFPCCLVMHHSSTCAGDYFYW
jgi:hypothetical protein